VDEIPDIQKLVGRKKGTFCFPHNFCWKSPGNWRILFLLRITISIAT